MKSQLISPVRTRHRKMSCEVLPLSRGETLRDRKLQIRRKLNQLADEFYKLKYDHEDESRELQKLMQRGEQLCEKVEIVRTKVITDNEKMKESMRKECQQTFQSPIPVKDLGDTRLNTQISSSNSDTEVVIESLPAEVEIPLKQKEIQILVVKQQENSEQLVNNQVKLQLLPEVEKHGSVTLSGPKYISLGKSCQMPLEESVQKSMKSRRRLFQSHRGHISAVVLLLCLGIVLLYLFV